MAPRKKSVFIGRETQVDSDEVARQDADADAWDAILNFDADVTPEEAFKDPSQEDDAKDSPQQTDSPATRAASDDEMADAAQGEDETTEEIKTDHTNVKLSQPSRRHRRRTKEELATQYPSRSPSARISKQLQASSPSQKAKTSVTPTKTPSGKPRGRPPKKTTAAKPGRKPQAQSQWEVEKIVGCRFGPGTKKRLYEVKWKNFPESANTWEPETNLDGCEAAIAKFEGMMKRG